MQLLVSFFIICLLEQDIGADPGIPQLAVILHGSRRDVDVDPADSAVLVLDAVNGPDALQDVFDGVFYRMLPGFDGQPFVAHVLQRDDLRPDLLLGQLLSRDVLILTVIRTVDASVHAVIGQIQGREHDDPVAVKMLLDLFAQIKDLLYDRGILAFQQRCRLLVGQPLVLTALLQDLLHQFQIVLVLLGIGQRRPDLRIVDELFCFF